MVKKLYKHEFAYYLRSMLPVYGILLAIAAMSRIIFIFEADNTVYEIISSIAVLSYVLAIVAALVMTMVFTITRYYRHLFTSEGYLSFTLPITPTQHILTKLNAAVVFHLLSVLVVIVSACIITSGDVLVEVIKAIDYIFGELPAVFAKEFRDTTAAQWQVNFWLFVIEFIVLIIAAYIYQMLLFYSCITVGQMFNKNRILAAVGVYFGYYMATQAVGTVFVIVSTLLPWEDLSLIFQDAPIPCIHGVMLGSLLLNLLISTAMFFICRYIIRHRLNLE